MQLPHDCLLRGISRVTDKGVYELVDPRVPFRFETVAQRLLSGRICLALAAVDVVDHTLSETIKYASQRNIPTGVGTTTPLSQLPVLHSHIDLLRRTSEALDLFTGAVMNQYVKAKVENRLVFIVVRFERPRNSSST